MNMMIKVLFLSVVFILYPLSLVAQDASPIEASNFSKENCPWRVDVILTFENYIDTLVNLDGFKAKVDISELTIYQIVDDLLEYRILIVLHHPKVDFGAIISTAFFLLDASNNSVQLISIAEILRAGCHPYFTPQDLFGFWPDLNPSLEQGGNLSVE